MQAVRRNYDIEIQPREDGQVAIVGISPRGKDVLRPVAIESTMEFDHDDRGLNPQRVAVMEYVIAAADADAWVKILTDQNPDIWVRRAA